MAGAFLKMTKSFDFIFDFAGPNGYLVHKVLPDFCAHTGATANYIPCLLGGMMKATNNQPPMIRYAETPAKRDYEMLEFNRFIQANSLTAFKMNPHFPVNSLIIMRGAVAAQHEGVFMPYAEAMFAAMWEDGANLGDTDVIAEVITATGLDATTIIARAHTPEVKAELVANTDAAVARGAFGIPTFYVGHEMFWGKERLSQVEAALNAID
jgi:2-hydroxychromene-2-carboxylate isomerase